jgi:hypothetical protein
VKLVQTSEYNFHEIYLRELLSKSLENCKKRSLSANSIPSTSLLGGMDMMGIVLSTVAIFGIGLGFANLTDSICEKRSFSIQAEDNAPSSDSERPVLEKCKKKKR